MFARFISIDDVDRFWLTKYIPFYDSSEISTKMYTFLFSKHKNQ